jgi:hypothetical protein
MSQKITGITARSAAEARDLCGTLRWNHAWNHSWNHAWNVDIHIFEE